ncbi:MAG: hypothetical protein JWN24_488 [Phycisphaerales bacterium]|nr:hypothetical protein [Phycisphaerales bacterium]
MGRFRSDESPRPPSLSSSKFRILEMRLRELLLSLTDAPAEQQAENVKQVIALESKPAEGVELP